MQINRRVVLMDQQGDEVFDGQSNYCLIMTMDPSVFPQESWTRYKRTRIEVESTSTRQKIWRELENALGPNGLRLGYTEISEYGFTPPRT